MNNKRIRIAMVETNTKQWEVAKMLGMSESLLSKKLREELPKEEQDRIVDLITQERGDNCEH